MRKPTATIYQNQDGILLLFSISDGEYRGSTTHFENSICDGASCGISGFDSVKERNKFLKENNYKKKGTVNLGVYCWDRHYVATLGGQVHGGTATCKENKNHKGKHKGYVSGGFDKDKVLVRWK